eukprot:scaffold5498_cov75-Phaeocystis_antarctica.AAC.3
MYAPASAMLRGPFVAWWASVIAARADDCALKAPASRCSIRKPLRLRPHRRISATQEEHSVSKKVPSQRFRAAPFGLMRHGS